MLSYFTNDVEFTRATQIEENCTALLREQNAKSERRRPRVAQSLSSWYFHLLHSTKKCFFLRSSTLYYTHGVRKKYFAINFDFLYFTPRKISFSNYKSVRKMQGTWKNVGNYANKLIRDFVRYVPCIYSLYLRTFFSCKGLYNSHMSRNSINLRRTRFHIST